jgi:CP family cyanate transporter-like MFS transporter
MKETPLHTTEQSSTFRWVVLTFILVVQLQLKAVLFAPAALASPIITNLRLTRTDFGLIMSAVNITAVICLALGSVLVDRAGLKLALLCGLALTGLGAAIQLGAHSLRFLIFARVFQGIGIAISYPVLGGLIMAWFPNREKPYINTIVVAVGFLGAGAAMIGTAELFRWFGGSWQHALGFYGVSLIATAIVWLVIGRNREEGGSAEKTTAACLPATKPSSLSRVLAMPVAWTLGLAVFAASWVLDMYFSFVPLFLQSRGLSLANANRLASMLPFGGIAGVIVFGVLATRATWRKHLLWTSCAIVILGSIPLFWGEGAVTNTGLLVAGFGLAGFFPVAITYMMGLQAMTPPLLAALVVMENVASGMAGFTSPLAVGWVSQSSFGLRNTLALFSWMELVAIAMFLRLPAIAGTDVLTIETTSASSSAVG